MEDQYDAIGQAQAPVNVWPVIPRDQVLPRDPQYHWCNDVSHSWTFYYVFCLSMSDLWAEILCLFQTAESESARARAGDTAFDLRTPRWNEHSQIRPFEASIKGIWAEKFLAGKLSRCNTLRSSGLAGRAWGFESGRTGMKTSHWFSQPWWTRWFSFILFREQRSFAY